MAGDPRLVRSGFRDVPASATEEQAAVVQQIARDVLGGKGFAVDYEGQDEDGLGVTMVVLP